MVEIAGRVNAARYMTVATQRALLCKLLAAKSFKYSDKPIFSLVSGKKSHFYIDCKMTTLFSHGLVLVGNVVFDLIASLDVKGIGGLTLGADAIANSAAMIAGQKGVDFFSFVIRKEPKQHGTMKWVEGGISSGDKVVIIMMSSLRGGRLLRPLTGPKSPGRILSK